MLAERPQKLGGQQYIYIYVYIYMYECLRRLRSERHHYYYYMFVVINQNWPSVLVVLVNRTKYTIVEVIDFGLCVANKTHNELNIWHGTPVGDPLGAISKQEERERQRERGR